jgi:hypothetical protein
MLEPMDNAFANVGATDLRNTVFPELAVKGYATLRYTDSGATSDKFQNLGQYDVVLVNSHMNPDTISLSTINPSTNSYDLPASQLNYVLSKNSLVILTGCKSSEGYPTKSPLANAVSSAYLSGGYADEVAIVWNADYLSYFFDALYSGNTASYANYYANNLATAKWGSDQLYIPLEFYPTNWQHDFRL